MTSFSKRWRETGRICHFLKLISSPFKSKKENKNKRIVKRPTIISVTTFWYTIIWHNNNSNNNDENSWRKIPKKVWVSCLEFSYVSIHIKGNCVGDHLIHRQPTKNTLFFNSPWLCMRSEWNGKRAKLP